MLYPTIPIVCIRSYLWKQVACVLYKGAFYLFFIIIFSLCRFCELNPGPSSLQENVFKCSTKWVKFLDCVFLVYSLKQYWIPFQNVHNQKPDYTKHYWTSWIAGLHSDCSMDPWCSEYNHLTRKDLRALTAVCKLLTSSEKIWCSSLSQH